MYYSENVRKKKVQELQNNQRFMDYVKERWVEIRDTQSRCRTFEEYLLDQVFELYDNFTLIQFLEKSDQKTIDRVLSEALKGL